MKQPQKIFIEVSVEDENSYYYVVSKKVGDNKITHVNETTAIIFTPEELEQRDLEIAGNAFEAGAARYHWERADYPVKYYLSKTEYLQSLK